jgi:predicted DsbA family dithiol-disulfide isomerase
VLLLTIFSDFTCPYSYVTEAGLRRVVGGHEGVEVRYRALELYPAPAEPGALADEAGWEEAVRPLAERLGITLRAPAFRPRTRKAHEAARFAEEQGVGEAMRDAIYRAYWAEERDIGRVDVLMEIAASLGLDPVDLKIALDIDQYSESVVHDQRLAERLRVPGAPTIFVGTGATATVLVGAQSPEALDEALRAG